MVALTSPVKSLFPTLRVCTLWLVALFQQGAHHLTLSPLFVSYWDMMKCIFLHGFCFYIHCPVSKPAESKYRWFLSQLRLDLLSFQVYYNWWHQSLIVLCRLDETSKFFHFPHEKVCCRSMVARTRLYIACYMHCQVLSIELLLMFVVLDDCSLTCLLIVRKVLCSITQMQSTFCCRKRKVAAKLISRG